VLTVRLVLSNAPLTLGTWREVVGIELLFNSAMVSTSDAEEPIAFLVKAARARGDRHREVLPRLLEVGEHLAPRIDHAGLGALFEWWLICGLGHRGMASRVFSPALGEIAIPETLRTSMNALLSHRMDAGNIPILDWVVSRRRYEQTLGTLRSKLFFSRVDDDRNLQEHRTWTEMIAEYQQAVDVLITGGIPDDPGWKTSDFSRFLRKSTVSGGSSLEKNLKNRGSELAELTTLAIEQATALEPFSLDIDVHAIGRGNLDSVEVAFRPTASLLLADLVDGEVDFADSAEEALVRGLESVDKTQINRLVALGIDWLETLQHEIPVISDQAAQYLRLSEAARTKANRGLDVEIIRIHLDDGDFESAERELSSLDEEYKNRQWDAELRARCTKFEQMLTDAEEELVDDLEWISEKRIEVNKIRSLIGQVDRSDIARALTEIERELDERRRDLRDGHALNMVAELEMIGGSDLTDILSQYSEAARERRLTQEDITDLEELLESERAQLNRRFDRELGMFIDRFTEVEDQLNIELIDEGKRLIEDAKLVEDEVEPDSELVHRTLGRISALRQRIENLVLRTWRFKDGETDLIEHVVAYVCERAGFTEFDVRRFHTALKSKRFVVLSGLTGTGKSTLARLYAESLDISSDNDQFARIAVRPNWIDQSEVLGYINPITNDFQPGWLASMMLRCRRNPNRLHFCLLDEMNLAPVEQYLADVLSAIEEEGSGSTPRITLYPVDARPNNRDEWPPSITLPPNLFFVGTVNIDESTRALTDRVIDRGHMIQLSVTVGREHHREPRERLEPRWRVEHHDWTQTCQGDPDPRFHDFLIAVSEILQKMRIGMGIRTHIEIERFIANATASLDPEDALDVALLQRLVPKIQGYRRDLADALQELRELFAETGADRSARVIEYWLDDSRSDDEFVFGTDPFLGVVTS
jgi:hypothetical protein